MRRRSGGVSIGIAGATASAVALDGNRIVASAVVGLKDAKRLLKRLEANIALLEEEAGEAGEAANWGGLKRRSPRHFGRGSLLRADGLRLTEFRSARCQCRGPSWFSYSNLPVRFFVPWAGQVLFRRLQPKWRHPLVEMSSGLSLSGFAHRLFALTAYFKLGHWGSKQTNTKSGTGRNRQLADSEQATPEFREQIAMTDVCDSAATLTPRRPGGNPASSSTRAGAVSFGRRGCEIGHLIGNRRRRERVTSPGSYDCASNLRRTHSGPSSLLETGPLFWGALCEAGLHREQQHADHAGSDCQREGKST